MIFRFNIAIIGNVGDHGDELTTDRNQDVIQLVRKQFRIWPTEWGMLLESKQKYISNSNSKSKA